MRIADVCVCVCLFAVGAFRLYFGYEKHAVLQSNTNIEINRCRFPVLSFLYLSSLPSSFMALPHSLSLHHPAFSHSERMGCRD